MKEGGLTPSYGILKDVLDSVSIPINVVVRPHSFHYIYDEKEINVILEDIKMILSLGGNRIVFGSLNQDHTINESALQKIINLDPNIIITFHGAIDHSNSILDSYQLLLKYKKNVQCIVTAGGEKNALKGSSNLSEIVKMQKKYNGPIVMPAVGLRLDNIENVHNIVRADKYHFGTGVRIGGLYSNGYDKKIIEKIKNIVTNN